ncbi:maestro heat-like repeat-containing protein family member 1 isoform X1 [Dasypus novemcinctus]|uniref:maestro heat-like repeat-containing protein family member 1 isoform X1 n=1 Tax=Dasypus novemcinctus TaxID=9361 RepID=UPI00265DCD33|nr:maestro heat-like repeat-containing protein family member 1 isoform X2 [Dasypus novemcinctus]
MVVSSETCEGSLEWEILERSIRNFIELSQGAGPVKTSQAPIKLSTDLILHNLKLLEVRIVNHKMATPLCQKMTDLILNFLMTVKPEGELEEACTMVLLALGFHNAGMVIMKLWDRMHQDTLPPRSLLVAVGKLNLCHGTATYIGATWEYVLRLLRKAQEENDRLALCHVLRGLATSARMHLDLGTKDEEKMDITPELLSIKAYQTLRVLYNRWSLKSKSKVTEQALVIIGHLFYLVPPPKLKNQVNWLTRWLMTLMAANLNSFYISQCICQLLDALFASGSGGINLASQLENIADMLFRQVSEKVNSSDIHSMQNHNLALKSFFLLTKLYTDQVVHLLLKNLESKDINEIVSALEVFKDVFHGVPQTEKLRSEVMHSVILVIQDDLKPVRVALLNFLEKLGQYDYLDLPQGNVIINYIIKLSEPDPSNEENVQLMCSKILQRVSLPQLLNLMCQPSNALAFVALSKTATEMALKAQALGQTPYLSNYHLRPSQFISPQQLLTHLVLFSLKPYRGNEFGVSSLRLLSALHPITSLHPVIHSNVGQLWMKMIPQMLHILNDNTVKSLNQKEWEDRLLKFLSQSLLAIDDDDWLEQLTQVILEKINIFNKDGEEKAFLYKFFGVTLCTSRNQKLVKRMLSFILKTTHEELLEREGIAVAFSIVSQKHLKIALDELKEYSTILTNKDTSSILNLMKEHQQREWGLVCNTICLIYNKIILENQETIFMHLEAILTLVLQHYHDCIVEKDKNLKLDYLNALISLTELLSSLSIICKFTCPHKLKIVDFLMELIKAEPVNCLSSSLRQKAMTIITNFRKIKPLLDPEVREELLRTCYKSVLCLPPADVLQKEAPSPKDGQANVELLRETLESLRMLMEALIIEMPTRVQNCLEYLNTWLNSQKDHERERAMWCTARILGFTVKMNNFQTEIEFTRLGRLVRLLAIRCQDPVDNICFLSSQAVYNLYCILVLQKQMGRKKQGLWEEEGKSEVYSANVFYNNTFKIAKAFAEYFTEIQATTLVLTAMEGLTDSRAKVSLAAAQLMSAVMKERGKDMIKVQEIVEGIVERLNLQLEPSTKEETLQAMCSLAGNNSQSVVPLLLHRPLPWDRTNLALWKAFGTQRETTINVLQLLIGILEKHHLKLESQEIDFQSVAVTCALCEMLSGSLCQEAVQELYPRLLISVLCHLYWVIEQNTPQKMVVYSKEGGPGSKSKPLDPTSCALEAVKLVIQSAAYDKVVLYANDHHCWDLLSCPKFYYVGIMELTSKPWPPLPHPSGIVKNCQPYILHRILNHVRNLLYSTDNHWKILARTCYAQLLWHRSVAQTLGQDFLGNLIKWIKEPSLIMKEVGLRGISNLALHPGQSEILKNLVPLLRGFLKDEVRVTMQAVKSLRNIICHGQGEDTKVAFCSISKQLCPLLSDERDQVRISATSALGHMLHQINKFKPGTTIQKEIYAFLVPLLLSIQDNNAEVVKACGGALTEWTNVIGWSSLTQTFRHITLSDHIQVLEETCKHLVNTSRTHLVGELLFQSFGFLKSPQPSLRAAAVTFIGLTAKQISLNQIHEDDMTLLQKALENLRDDPVETIQSLVDTVLKKIDTYMHPESEYASRLSRMSSSFFKFSGFKPPAPRKRLFKIGKLEEVDNKEKKHWNWLRLHVNSLPSWHHGR